MNKFEYFAVIDTETNWNDEVMSVGMVIADASDLEIVDKIYCIITPECNAGGFFSSALNPGNVYVNLKSSRSAVTEYLLKELRSHDITALFAYNASFDSGHLSELNGFTWYDIMKIAAYKQYNRSIPEDADCFKTGRLKCNYDVETIMRMLTGKKSYHETHNAVCDAVDELKIMKLLGHPIDTYEVARIN